MSRFDDILSRHREGKMTASDLDKLIGLAEAARVYVPREELRESVERLKREVRFWKREAGPPVAVGRYAQVISGIIRDTEAELARKMPLLEAWGDLFGETLG